MFEYKRILNMQLPVGQSTFLWGARRTGKSFYLKKTYPKSVVLDLLNTEVYWKYLTEPHQLRHEVSALTDEELAQPIIIDEIQLVPQLLNEVHWLIENTNAYFILCGSSARKLRRSSANMLGGRAWSYHFYPLVRKEVTDFDLLKALKQGLIPSHYLSQNWKKSSDAYIQNYLTEEIKAESLVRNLVAFSKFLKVAAHSNGEILNYSNIAKDCHVDSKTVKEYYQILVDTLLGYYVEAYTQNKKRQDLVASPKFYFFDVGVVNALTNQSFSALSGLVVGQAFEHFILMEIMAYKGLMDKSFDISFWRTRSGYEVDFVLGEADVAIEVKLSENISTSKLKGLIEFTKLYRPKHTIVVCRLSRKQRIEIGDDLYIDLIPYEQFLYALWDGELI